MSPESRRVHPAADLALEWIVRAIGLLPRRIAMRAGGLLSSSFCALLPRKRDRALRNAKRCGVANERSFYRRAAREFGRTTFELIWLIAHPQRPVLQDVEVQGLDCLREAAAEGRGVLLASGHFGTWDFVAPAAALAGTPVAGTANSWRYPRLERRLIALRDGSGVKTMLRGERGTGVAAYRWLKEGGIYCCMMDRIREGRKIMIPFVGEGLFIPTGPAEMADRCGAAVVVAFSTRRADGSSLVQFRRIDATEFRCATSLAQRIGREIEQQLLDCPEQWFWIFRRNPYWPGSPGALRAERNAKSLAG